MATELWTNREPEVAKFIDSYKFDQDMSVKRDKFGGGTSLPLNSDGYEDKQRRLRDERHDEWLVQMDKPKEPVYYRVGTPEQGFPGLGDYEKLRQEKNLLRQKEYNEMLKKQRQLEQEKLDARRHAPPPRPAQPPGPQVDYNAAFEQAKAEDRRAYQDYMKAKEERYWAMRGRPVTPPGGLNIGNYDRQVKEQAPAKKLEYKKMLDEQQREHMFLRARQEPEMAVLDRNSQPPQYLANKPPPGPSYGRGRDEAEQRRHEDDMFRQQQQKNKPAEVVKNPFYSSDDYEKFQKELQRKQGEEYQEFLSQGEEQGRHSRDNNRAGRTTYSSSYTGKQETFKPGVQTPPRRVRSREHRSDQMSQVLTFKEQEERNPLERGPPVQNGYTQSEPQYNSPPVKDYQEQNGIKEYQEQNGYPMDVSEPGDYRPRMPDYSMANPDTFHQQMTAPYPKASSAPNGSPPATPSKLSLPVGQYDDMRPFIVKQRNKEYNVLKEKLPPLKKTGMTPRATEVGLPIGQYDKERPVFEKQRNVEYNELIQTGRIGKSSLRQKIPTPPNLQGLPIGQQQYDPMYRAMEHQRNKEYNEFLKQKYGGKMTMRSTRSEPARSENPKSSFYYGNEMEQTERKKMLNAERRNEYNMFMKEQGPPRSRSIDIPTDVDSGLPIGQQHHEAWRKFLRGQRKAEYNQLVDRQKVTNPGRRHEFVDTASGPYGGLFHGLGEHGPRSDDLNRERQREYNERLNQQYAGKDRPSGRPKWAQDSLPNNTDRGHSPMKNQPPADQYEQMLNEKRREEANLRRFEDPEYQDRLSRGRDRGDDGPRYNYH